MELVLILFLTLGGLVFIGYPLFTEKERWMASTPKTPTRREELNSRKLLALTAIKELEFDYRTGKLSPEDYELLRSRYESDAMEAMKGLDGLKKGGRRFRTNQGKDDTLICSSCGEAVPSSSRYCSNCGTRFNGANDPS